MEKAMSLFELNAQVRDAIEMNLEEDYWVFAELSDVHESRGHCYMDLIEKSEGQNTPVARAQAVCWKQSWILLAEAFFRITGEKLHAGMKVLLQVHASFHESYGFKWVVTDVDPTFTLGDMARKRQAIVAALKSDGVFHLQHELELPMFCQRIAVISADTAAGYGDFTNQLHGNAYGLKFHTELFPAVMQGEGVENSVVQALDRINLCIDSYDCVVIIRGGGATADMSGFDTMRLAENVVNFPLPVITGIGHTRDESVLDMIACKSEKTPTAVATFLIEHLLQVVETLNEHSIRLARSLESRLRHERNRLQQLCSQLQLSTERKLSFEVNKMSQLHVHLANAARLKLQNEIHQLEIFESKMQLLDPNLLLSKGYSVTLKNGHAVKAASELTLGERLQIQLAEGYALVEVVDMSQKTVM